jgi:hypothetical protein
LTVPAACALVLATIFVVPVTMKAVAGVVPKLTDVAPFRSVPVIVTVVPPSVEPLVVVKEVIVGVGTMKVKLPVEVSGPSGVVTVISTVPDACGAVWATMVCVSTTVKITVVVPNLTDVAPMRFVPVIVTVVPPSVDPLVGA